MSTLYLECNSGISGDMTVAALIDAGADASKLEEVLKTIPCEGFEIKISRVNKQGLDCCDFNVLLDKEHENHDHDMNYLYGHDHEKEETHDHEHEHHHDHEHGHEHTHDEEHHHHHAHTNLHEVCHIIDHTSLNANANALAKKIFNIIAQAESKAHGIPIEEVHFHEVGAIDSIVDIISAAFCLDNLGIDKVIVPKMVEGTGTVRCQHGILSIPVPAVTNIVEAYNLPVEISQSRKGELITPTGAAIVAAVKTDDKLPESFKIKKCGMGAGKREYEIPSIVRAFIIEDNTDTDRDVIYKLETDIDDCTGEALGFVVNKLMEAGAREAHFSPIFMKKNRPAYELTVICTKDKKEELEKIIFLNTTTIGIRSEKMERSILKREAVILDTVFGEVLYKKVSIGKQERLYPEYESIVKICEEKKLSYQEVYAKLMGMN